MAEVVPFACGVAVWQLLSWLNIWPRVLFPSPTDVFWAFIGRPPFRCFIEGPRRQYDQSRLGIFCRRYRGGPNGLLDGT